MSQWAVTSAQEVYLKWRGQPADPNVALRADLYTPAARAMWEPEAARIYRGYLVAVGFRYVMAAKSSCDQAVVAFLHENGVTFLDEQELMTELTAQVEAGTGTDIVDAGGYGANYSADCGSCAEVVDSSGGEVNQAGNWAALNMVADAAIIAGALQVMSGVYFDSFEPREQGSRARRARHDRAYDRRPAPATGARVRRW
jgi:hypothetical protein